MTNAFQSREVAVDNEKKPFVYDKDDEFYLAPAVCHLMHYRNAAVLCGILEIILLILAVFAFLSKLSLLVKIYGIVTENPKYIWPLMAFMHIEITILIIAAILSITSMSMGLQTTHRLFGFYVSIQKLENHFGPIWPFNLAVMSFFGATIIIWSYIIVRGAYDYLLDKEYFTKKPNIEMVKTIVVNKT
ncbi:unnamed protein product [Onchocerca ochengi]|uniref:Uncharacterized protein n=1 Tax=Onchocerca ochengi TaxID=42157 RepID=A0A182E4L2_ONCOC|nr:unnamed protein product [Onchocerca ochengi]